MLCKKNPHKQPCAKMEYPLVHPHTDPFWSVNFGAVSCRFPPSQCFYIMHIILPVSKDPWQLQVVIQVFSLGTMDLIEKIYEPKAKAFGSLQDPASGCSTPRGWKHQMNRVSSSPALEVAKLSLNEQKHIIHFQVGLRKHLCPLISLPNIAYEEWKPRWSGVRTSGQLGK